MTTIDPIKLEIWGSRLVAIADFNLVVDIQPIAGAA